MRGILKVTVVQLFLFRFNPAYAGNIHSMEKKT